MHVNHNKGYLNTLVNIFKHYISKIPFCLIDKLNYNLENHARIEILPFLILRRTSKYCKKVQLIPDHKHNIIQKQ